jgi:hypothetical protein
MPQAPEREGSTQIQKEASRKMTSIWTSLTASSVALAPLMALLRLPGGSNGLQHATVTTTGPSPCVKEAGLKLALEQGLPGHMPDFIFERDLASRGKVSVWHPDPHCRARLDSVVLETMIEAMAAGQIGDEETSTRLQLALSGQQDVRNVEIGWRDSEGTERCWLLSTSATPANQSRSIVTGLVRDVSTVHSHCNEINARLQTAHRDEQAITASTSCLADTVREQALLISGICDLLARPLDQLTGDGECDQSEFVFDVRQAVRQIVINADLLKDYTHARQGTLKLTPQTWSAEEVFSITTPMLNSLMAGCGVSLEVQESHPSTSLVCDPYKLSRFLFLELSPLCRASIPGSTASLSAGPRPGGGIILELQCRTKAPEAQHATSMPLQGPGEPALHPALSKPFRDRLIAAHAAQVSLQALPQDITRLTIALGNFHEEHLSTEG